MNQALGARKKRENHGAKWTTFDEWRVLSMACDGLAIPAIAVSVGRSPYGTSYRLEHHIIPLLMDKIHDVGSKKMYQKERHRIAQLKGDYDRHGPLLALARKLRKHIEMEAE